jgi:hypothetical protein
LRRAFVARDARRLRQLCTSGKPPAVHLKVGQVVQTSGATSDELREKLLQLARKLEAGNIEKAAAWRGADVQIGYPKRKLHHGRDRYVGTRHVGALSWMFSELREAFSKYEVINHSNKIDFYGRLANAAIRCVQERDSKLPVCAAVLHEALLQPGSYATGRLNRSQ